MSRMYGNGDPMGMGGDIRYDINKDPAMDSYLGSKYEIYQDTGRIDVGRWSLEMDNMGEIMKDIDKADPLYVATIIKGGKKGLLVAYKYGEKIVNGFVVHAALGEAEVEAAMSGRIMDREKMKVELENVRIVGPVVEAITPDIVKKFIREKIEDMTPSEKLADGVIGDAIVIIPIIKGATGVIKQAGEWVAVGKDIAGGAKKLFTKPDTPHHKTYTDTGGHKVDGDSHLGLVKKFTLTDKIKSDITAALQKGNSAEISAALKKAEWDVPQSVFDKLPAELKIKKLAKEGIGVRMQDVSGDKFNVRIMKGKPDAEWPSQRQDYVKITSNGKVLDFNGNEISSKQYKSPSDQPEAHIPLNKWLKWKEWDKND
jgi:hypothetical protein